MVRVLLHVALTNEHASLIRSVLQTRVVFLLLLLHCSDSSRTTVHTQKFKCHFSKTQSLLLLLKTIQTLEGSRISTLKSTLHFVSHSSKSPTHRSQPITTPETQNSTLEASIDVVAGLWQLYDDRIWEKWRKDCADENKKQTRAMRKEEKKMATSKKGKRKEDFGS